MTDEDRLTEIVATAMQESWNEHTSDTGCVPEAFEIRGPRTTRVFADMKRGNFARSVAERVAASLVDNATNTGEGS